MLLQIEICVMEITKEIRGKENFTIDILKDGETIAIQIRLDDNCNNYIEYHFCWEEPCKFIHCKMTRTTIGDILCWGGRYFREDYFLSYILPKAGKIFVYPGDWECWSAEHTEEKVEIIEGRVRKILLQRETVIEDVEEHFSNDSKPIKSVFGIYF